MSTSKAIEVKALSKSFALSKQVKRGRKGKMQKFPKDMKHDKRFKKGKFLAVHRIQFSVKQGEIFGFLGPNGAGKTTTIRMLTGVLKPSGGNVSILGKNIWKDPISVKEIIGNVPEMANVYMDLTALQNLYFIGEIYGISKSDRESRAEDLLTKFDLFEKRHLKAKKYSKGMKQRLLLCMALMNDPKILFLDEPTSGLDVQSSRIIKKIIKEYNKHGVTIFMTTHDMSVANEMCDTIAIINQGEIVKLDSPQNLRKLGQEYQAINMEFLNDIEVDQLESLDSVKKVSIQKEAYHIVVGDIDKGLHNICEYAKNNQIKIKEINTHKPSLEDVFVQIIKNGENN